MLRTTLEPLSQAPPPPAALDSLFLSSASWLSLPSEPRDSAPLLKALLPKPKALGTGSVPKLVYAGAP